MFIVIGNSGHTAYGTKEFLCDTLADIDLLPIDITPVAQHQQQRVVKYLF